MAFFEFPHTRTYDSDLGWLIRHTKALIDCCDNMTEWKAKHEREYEELVNTVNGLVNSLIEVIRPWDSSIAYQIFTIVEYQGQNYIAIQDVPVGAMITDTTYWQPANTTIEQINAIGAIVSNIQENWNVVPEFDDLYETTTDRVIVLNDNGYYGSGCTVVYEEYPYVIDPDQHGDGYLRANGTYVAPVPKYGPPAANAPMVEISEVIGSYLNKSNLVIDLSNGTHPFNMDLEPGTMNGIDCSTFADLIVRGITYDNSRYVATNPYMKYGQYVGNCIPRTLESYRFNTTNYNAAEQALFYAGQNRLFWIDYTKEKPAAQLAPGDLLYYTLGDPDAGRYMHIGHVSMVLNVFPESNRVIIAQCGGAGTTIRYKAGTPAAYPAAKLSILEVSQENYMLLFARPCYSPGKSFAPNMLAGFRSMGDVLTPDAANGAVTIGYGYPDRNLQEDQLYTFVFEGVLPDGETDKAVIAIAYTYNDGTRLQQNLTGLHEQGKLIATVPGPENSEDVRVISFYAYVPSDATDITQRTVNLTSCSMVKGSVSDINGDCLTKQAVLENLDSDVTQYQASRAFITPTGTKISCSIKIAAVKNAAFTLGYFKKDCVVPGSFSRPVFLFKPATMATAMGYIKASTNEVVCGPIPETGDWNLYGWV